MSSGPETLGFGFLHPEFLALNYLVVSDPQKDIIGDIKCALAGHALWVKLCPLTDLNSRLQY